MTNSSQQGDKGHPRKKSGSPPPKTASSRLLDPKTALVTAITAAITAVTTGFIDRLVDAVPLKYVVQATACIALLALLTFIWRRFGWRHAIPGLIVITLLGTLIARGTILDDRPNDGTPRSSKLIILVANFVGPDPQKYIVTETLVDNLRANLARHKDIEVVALERPLLKQTNDAARDEGKKHNAAVVIWGRYAPTRTHVGMAAHVLILQPSGGFPRLGPGEQGALQIASIASLENFHLQVRLSKRMAYFSLIVAGVARHQAKDWAAAVVYFSEALQQITPDVSRDDRSTVHYYRGVMYWLQKDRKHAHADFTEAIKLNPKSANAYVARAASTDRQDPEVIIADCNRAIRLDPKHDLAYMNRGYAYSSKKEHAKAIADFSKAIELGPEFAEAHSNRAASYIEIGQFDRAIYDANQALKFEPTLGDAYALRGIAYAAKGNLDQAIGDYSRAIQLRDDDLYLIYLGRGTAYIRKGTVDLAIADFNEALKLRPNVGPAYTYRGAAYARRGDLDQAINDLNRGVRLSPQSAEAYFHRARAYVLAGDANKAIADFKRVLTLDPNATIRRDTEATLKALGYRE